MSFQRLSIRYGTRVILGIGLLLLLVLPILAAPLQQGCATMGFSPPNAWAVQVGDTIVLRVPLDADGVAFYAVGLLLHFDPTLLQVVDAAGDPASQIEPGNLPGFNVMNTASNTQGTVEFVQAVLPPGQTGGDFMVATIRFKVMATLPAGGTQVTFVDGQGNTGVFWDGDQLLCEFPEPATISSTPVGGYVVPVNKLGLVAPWMGLVSLVGLAVSGSVLVRRRRGQGFQCR